MMNGKLEALNALILDENNLSHFLKMTKSYHNFNYETADDVIDLVAQDVLNADLPKGHIISAELYKLYRKLQAQRPLAEVRRYASRIFKDIQHSKDQAHHKHTFIKGANNYDNQK